MAARSRAAASVLDRLTSDHHPTSAGAGPGGFGEYHEAAHSVVDYAVGLAEACAVGQLLLYHHDPPRTDDEIDAILAGLDGVGVPVGAAAEGDVIDLGS